MNKALNVTGQISERIRIPGKANGERYWSQRGRVGWRCRERLEPWVQRRQARLAHVDQDEDRQQCLMYLSIQGSLCSLRNTKLYREFCYHGGCFHNTDCSKDSDK